MVAHRVAQGESVVTIARRYGFGVDDLWNHPDNAELKRIRKTPNVLLPGDCVAVPDLELRWVDAATERRHSFRLSAEPVKLAVRFLREGVAKGGWRYVLEVEELRTEGALDGDGWFRAEVHADVQEVGLTLEDPTLTALIRRAYGNEEPPAEMLSAARHRYTLKVHHLDPIDTPSGVAQRLNHLGWACEPPESLAGDAPENGQGASRFAGSLHAFQRMHLPDAEPTGKFDDATRAKLEEVHGV